MPDDHDKWNEELQKFDQNSATLGDILPPMWRRFYNNCMIQGFTELQSLELVKTYILSSNIRYEK